MPGTVAVEGQLAGWASVLIPVYNEVGSIQTTLSRVLASPVPKEIIVVDDGSTDGTRELLQGLKDIPNFTLVYHDKNRGKGAAIRTGLQYARGEYVIIQDGDVEYDPRDYPALLEPLRQGAANVVYGVRPDRPERGIHYYLCAKLLTLLVNLLYGARIHDEATGYKVFRRSLLAGIPLECERFEFCPEITAKLCLRGEPIFEVPISYNPRTKHAGRKIGWGDGWMAIWTLLRWRFSGPKKAKHRAHREIPRSTESR
jgi:glycosyltransferase involved in cell wall biosynthesis